MMFKNVKIYIKCPEIRHHMHQLYAAKIASILTLALSSPLIILSLVSIGLVHIFDVIGEYAVTPVYCVIDWLEKYRQQQILEAHNTLSLIEIQKRIGTYKEDDHD